MEIKRMNTKLICALIVTAVVGLTGCREKTATEKAQDALNDAAKKTGNATEKAFDKTKEAVKDGAEATKKAVEKAGDAVKDGATKAVDKVKEAVK